jgi:hypothetical protein
MAPGRGLGKARSGGRDAVPKLARRHPFARAFKGQMRCISLSAATHAHMLRCTYAFLAGRHAAREGLNRSKPLFFGAFSATYGQDMPSGGND